MQTNAQNMFTVDVEEWFHLLDSPAVPPLEHWASLESRVEIGLKRILGILDDSGVKATFFWLGWLAERHPQLVRRCRSAGHEIASHGYAHLLAYQSGRAAFLQDIARAKHVLEDLTGEAVAGFRAPGFGITENALWAFAAIREAGYEYDSSVFPASRGHGGIAGAAIGPHWLETAGGPLFEIPQSLIACPGLRFSLFGGGYLRLAPLWLIHCGARHLHRRGRPLIVYIHPREADAGHPRLPLSFKRRVKSYINLNSVPGKLASLCGAYRYVTMREYYRSAAAKESPTARVRV